MGAVAAFAIALRAPLLFGGQIDYDEGVYWQSLRLLAAGHPLFSSVYSSQPPGFLLLLLPGHLAMGGTIVAARLTVVILSLAGVAAAGRAVWLLAGPAAGLLAAALLAADPLFFRESVAVQADGPAIALALVALAAAAEARGRPSRAGTALAAGAGAVLAVAVLAKLLAVAAVPAIAVLLLAGGGRPAVGRAGAATLGGLVAAAALLLPFAPAWGDLWAQVVGLHLGAARSLRAGGLDGPTVLRGLPVAAVAVAGCVAAVRRATLLAAVGAAWTVSAAVLLWAQHPLWPHHAVVLVAPLALLGGAVALVLPPRAAIAATGVVLLASVASAAYVRSLELPLAPVPALRAVTTARDLVITDDQFAVALSGRGTPPELVDTSFVRVASGDLTAADVEAAARRWHVRAVLLSTGRLEALPGLRAWLAQRFPEVTDLGAGRTLYARTDAG
jgi:4-amino-4-deoxy-L-arabinose transferase-like glycosyltransferase